jgi:putative acetyltransferase
MIGNTQLRPASKADVPAIADLAVRAFGRPDEGRIIQELEAAGDVWLQVMAEQERQLIGQCTFYFLPVKGRLGALGLGPMSVDPWIQKRGVGLSMMRFGIETAKQAGVPIVFVLGHATYYPKVGFSADAAKEFISPWTGRPEFMALRLQPGPPLSGQLVFPKAFGI